MLDESANVPVALPDGTIIRIEATPVGGGGLEQVGILDSVPLKDLLRTIESFGTPGTSALFVLAQDAVADRVRQRFESMHGHVEVLQTNLSKEQEDKLRQAFGDET